MNIHIDDGHDSTRVTVGGLAGLTVKVGGYEGIASRVKAPTYQLCEDDGNVVCEVKRPLVKGDKVIVFKKKRRKGYRRWNGHRQYFTQIVIKDVVA